MKNTWTMQTIRRRAVIGGVATWIIAMPAIPASVMAGPSAPSPALVASAGLTSLPVADTTIMAPPVAPQDSAPPAPRPAALPAAGSPDQTSTPGGPSVSLDFVDASIVDVLKALSMQSGYNVVASPDVTGKVTVSLAHVTLETALDFVAKTAGFQWVKRDNTYVVGTQKSLAAFLPPPALAPAPPGRVTEAINVQFLDPDDVITALKANFPDVKVDLIKSKVRGGARSSEQASQNSGGYMDEHADMNQADLGFVLTVTGLPDVVEQVKQYVKGIQDQIHPSISEEVTTAYQINYAFGPDLMQLLHTLLPGISVSLGPHPEFVAGAPITFSSGLTERTLGKSAITGGDHVGSSNSDNGDNGNGSDQNGSGSGAGRKDYIDTSAPDSELPPSKTLILTGRPEDVNRALAILAKADVKQPQILFEAKVIEIDTNYVKNLGFQWNFTQALGSWAGAGSVSQFMIGSLQSITSTSANGATNTQITTNPSNLVQATMNALITDGHTKELASPNVSALDGQRATVFVGDTLNYISGVNASSSGQTTFTTSTINVGVQLSLSGRVASDGYITLYLHPEVSSVNQWTQLSSGAEIPTDITSRYADSVVRVKSGDTIAIGGLTRDEVINSTQKVPILGDLPILKNIFNYTSKQENKWDVLFLIKTTVLPDHA